MIKHKVGLYVGRFQPFHNGHLSIVKESLTHCARLILVIGSAQESGTEQNPFDKNLRRRCIERALGDLNQRVIVICVDDRAQVSDDSAWGEYMLKEVERQTGLRPTINFQGKEGIRSRWFDGIDIINLEVDRNVVPVSATQVRKAILNNNYTAFTKLVPKGMWITYGTLRSKLIEIKGEE